MISKIIFVIFFTAMFFAVRAPEYDIPLAGEDGIFADIFVNAPKVPLYGQNARINGKTIYSSLGHPSPLYEWLEISGKFFTKVLPLKKSADDDAPNLSTYLRFSFSCFQFTAWIFLLIYILSLPRDKSRWGDLFLLLALALSPPAITYSLWLQVDNASGSVIIAIFMSAIIFWDRKKTISTAIIAPVLISAGFVSGLGKNEWSLLVFLSLFATAIYVIYRKKKNIDNTQVEFLILLYLLLGLILGNIFSYLYNSTDYLAGMGLANQMAHTSSLANSSQLTKWWTITKIRMPVLYLSFALWLYISSIFVVKTPWKISVPIVLSFFISSAFLWSFFLSSYDSADRYFIPAFVALVFTLILIRTTHPHKLDLDKYVIFFILFLGIDIFNNFLSSRNNHQYRADHLLEYRNSIPRKQGCIHHINYYAFNLKNIDYVGVGNGPGNLEGHMRASGLKVCNP